ncbi:MAG: hypothetical protein JXA87_14535 [Thermoleophilia bacterium]|nr:hypothetical protein [Thermoleophilia bacterium]
MSPLTEIPTHREPTKAVSNAAIHAIAQSIAAGEEAGAPILRALAQEIVQERIRTWTEQATGEITAACESAAKKALKDWKKRKGDLDHQVARAVANTHTQVLMDRWAAAAIAQVGAEVDERGLISTDILRAITYTRPARKGESAPQKTDGVEALDEEFFQWWLTQLGEHGINTSNRLRLRLLLVAALDWIRDSDSGWRDPGLADL